MNPRIDWYVYAAIALAFFAAGSILRPLGLPTLIADWLGDGADNGATLLGAVLAGLFSVAVSIIVVRSSVAPIWRQVEFQHLGMLKEIRDDFSRELMELRVNNAAVHVLIYQTRQRIRSHLRKCKSLKRDGYQDTNETIIPDIVEALCNRFISTLDEDASRVKNHLKDDDTDEGINLARSKYIEACQEMDIAVLEMNFWNLSDEEAIDDAIKWCEAYIRAADTVEAARRSYGAKLLAYVENVRRKILSIDKVGLAGK